MKELTWRQKNKLNLAIKGALSFIATNQHITFLEIFVEGLRSTYKDIDPVIEIIEDIINGKLDLIEASTHYSNSKVIL